MKYKLIISDYDGTLGEAPSNNIDPETLQSINQFIKNGGTFIVCSGREYRSIRKICLEHGLNGLVVSFQGARIHEIESGKKLFDGGISAERAIELLEMVKPYGLDPIIYTEDGFYLERQSKYTEYYEKAVKMKGVLCDPKQKVLELGSVCKLGWLGDVSVIPKAVSELNEKCVGGDIKFNSGAPILLEAINSNCSKGNAVRFLADYYGVEYSQILAIGDSTNDIDLIKGEWHGVAVGDGNEELKAVAKEIAPPFKQKPVKYVIDKYCL